MKIGFLVTAFAISLASCGQDDVAMPQRQSQFELQALDDSDNTLLLEKNTGCVWLVTIDWTGIKPVGTQGRQSVQADKNFAKALDAYAIKAVRSKKREWCEEKFGLGINPSEELKMEDTK